jgi:predicted transcriptional regulator
MQKTSLPCLFTVKNTLGPLELEIMEMIWRSNKTTVRSILQQIRKRKPVAYTTIMTVMNNLYKKGFLKRIKIKKAYYYSPVVDKNYLIYASLSTLFGNLNRCYGKGKILFMACFGDFLSQINLAIVKTYGTSITYGLLFPLLLFLLSLSIYDLIQNFAFFGTSDYLDLLLSDAAVSSGRLQLFIFALLESLPIVNVLTTLTSFILFVILTKKLARIFNFRIPIINRLNGVI